MVSAKHSANSPNNKPSNHGLTEPKEQTDAVTLHVMPSKPKQTPSPTSSAMAYADEVARCQLDETLESLKRVDILLSQIRHELIKNRVTEQAFLSDQSNRKFILYIGQYSGQVLAKLWGVTPQWLTIKQLTDTTNIDVVHLVEHLSIHKTNFYHRLACRYQTSNAPDVLFFVLEPIGARLFGSMDRVVESVTGKPAQSSVFLAVQKLAPALATQSLTTQPSKTQHSMLSLQKQGKVDGHENKIKRAGIEVTKITENKSIETNNVITDRVIADNVIADNVIAEKFKPDGIQRIKNIPAITPKPKKIQADADPIAVLNVELLKDMQTVPHEQNIGLENYQKASKILDVFEGFIRSQSRPRNEVALSEKHNAMRRQAIELLEQSAKAGNTSAMLRLAMQQMLGEGTVTDLAGGAIWVQKAAELNDARAQRLLSKLFYQGVGVPQSLEQGKHWLTEAAKNNHPDAKSVLASWQQLEKLSSVQKEDAVTDKRYLILVAVVVVLAVVLFLIF